MSLYVSRDPDASLRQLLQAATAHLDATAQAPKPSGAAAASSPTAPVNAARTTTLSSSTLAFLSDHGGASALGGLDAASTRPGNPAPAPLASPVSGGAMPSLEDYIAAMLGGDPVSALKATG